MPAPPILEIYVVWHPDDDLGSTASNWLIEHFHGPAYAGLAGGAVEVYLRGAAWDGTTGPPRPMPFMQALPAGLAAAQITVVIPILGRGLARAVREDPRWRSYVESIFTADQSTSLQAGEDVVAVYPLAAPSPDLAGTVLATLAEKPQTLPRAAATSCARGRAGDQPTARTHSHRRRHRRTSHRLHQPHQELGGSGRQGSRPL
jgi:hypothetical protein